MSSNAITVTYYYTDEDLKDILITALEGGIGYWACLDNTEGAWNKQPENMPTSEYAWNILCDCGTLRFIDEEDDDEEYTMSIADFFKGIGLAIKNKDWDGDMDSLDACVADAIMQYAMLGSVVYG